MHVILFDSRRNDYGGYEKLLFLPKSGDHGSICILSDEKDRNGRRTECKISPSGVSWACIQSTCRSQKGIKKSYRAIPGLDGGPMVELQNFLDAWPGWVKSNIEPAIGWLQKRVAEMSEDEFEIPDSDYANFDPEVVQYNLKSLDKQSIINEQARQIILNKIGYASRKRAKNMIASAWDEVARALRVETKGNYSWTAVAGRPLSIALGLQKKKKFGGEKSIYKVLKGQRPRHPGKIEEGNFFTLPK